MTTETSVWGCVLPQSARVLSSAYVWGVVLWLARPRAHRMVCVVRVWGVGWS